MQSKSAQGRMSLTITKMTLYLQLGKPLENSAHKNATDGGGGFCWHSYLCRRRKESLKRELLCTKSYSHQPGKPIFGHASPHLHVPRVDEEHSSQVLARLVDRIHLPGIQVPTLTAGTNLEAWHPQLHYLYQKECRLLEPLLLFWLTALFISCTASVGACIGRVPRPTNREGCLSIMDWVGLS